MKVSWLDSLADVPPPLWDRLARDGGFYLSHAWLSLQESDPDSNRQYAVATTDEGKLLGGVPVDFVEQESNDFYRLSAVLPDGCAEPDAPLVVLGGHGGYRSGFVLDPLMDGELRAMAARSMIDEIVSTSRSAGRLALFFYLQQQFLELIVGVRGAHEPLLARHDATLELAGHTWDDYLAALSGGRRTKIRREVRRFDAAGFRVTVGDLTPWLDEAGSLLANVQHRYGHEADAPDMSEMLGEQIRDVGEHIAFLCADDQGLVGFALGFPFGDTLSLRAGGFAYERLRHAAEYFNMAFYLPIRWAYEHDIRSLHLGIESLEAKTLRGAALSPLWVTPVGWSWPDSAAIRAANDLRAATPLEW